MKKIYLVRHGESQWNILKKMQGQQDIPLTDEGMRQANLIGNRLINEKIDRIYSSDLMRAFNTAKIIGEKLNIHVTPMEEFREIKFGIWEGMSNKKMLAEYPDEFLTWKKMPENLRIEGAESLEQLQSRAMNGINKIMADKEDENILIVSHSATLKTIILSLLNIDLTHFKNLTLDNVSLTIIEMRDYNNVLKTLNDTCHVKEN